MSRSSRAECHGGRPARSAGCDRKNEREDTMRIFVAGASGALGSRLVPQLIDAGHEVIGTHNSSASGELLRRLGAKPGMLDPLDAGAAGKAALGDEAGER